MFAVAVEEPEIEPEPQIELKIHPSFLLKVRYLFIWCKLGDITQDKTAD